MHPWHLSSLLNLPSVIGFATRRIGTDIDLLGQLNVGSREALGINALEGPRGSLPSRFSALPILLHGHSAAVDSGALRRCWVPRGVCYRLSLDMSSCSALEIATQES